MENLKTKILELRNDGKTYDEISKILDCSRGTISEYCSNVLPNKINYIDGIDEEIQNEVIKYRAGKKKMIEIYNILNGRITKENIRILLRKNSMSYIDRLNEEMKDMIREEYRKVGKIKTVAKKLSISFMTIKSLVKDLEEEYGQYKVKSITDSQSVINWRKRTKQKLVEYKGGKCCRCEYDTCIEALEFHHIDPSEKDFTISGKSWSFERLKKEVDKCVLLCSRCHTELHNGHWNIE